MKIWQIAVVSVTMGAALPVIAQVPVGANQTPRASTRADVETRVRERLGRFDTNRDGTVTRDEMKTFADARMKTARDARFVAMDADKNGSISRAEFDAAPMARGMRGMREGRMGARMMGGDRMAGGKMRGGMMRNGGGMGMMADGSGQFAIADAVKKALERFDAADTNKDGTMSIDERRAARDARRAMWMSRARG